MAKTLKISFLSLSTIFLLLLSFTGLAQAGSEEYENEANDMINDVEQQLSDLRRMIDDAQGLDIYTSYYEDDLDDAEDFYDDAVAEDAKEDWDDALEFAEKAYDILDDAIDDLRDELSADAKKAIDEAEKILELADEAVDDTDRDDRNYDDAAEILDQAEEIFDDAEDAYEDEDYQEAEDLAEDAAELAEEVFDELDLNLDYYLGNKYQDLAIKLNILSGKTKVELEYDDAGSNVEKSYEFNTSDTDLVYKRLADELGLTDDEIEDAVTSIDIGDDIDVDELPEEEEEIGSSGTEVEAQIAQLLKLIELLTQLLALQLQD